MGSACCIAARDETVSNQARAGTSRKKSIRCISWIFGRQKPHVRSADNRNHLYSAYDEVPFYDDESWSSTSEEATSYSDSPEIAYASSQTLCVSPSSTLMNPIGDNLSSQTPSEQARFSPEHHLFRQVSGSTISGLKPLNKNSVSEGRPSSVISTFSNELADGSVSSSFDQRFLNTTLMASSHRERWSFDGSPHEFGHSKFSRCSSGLSYSSPGAMNLETCGICLKFLTERSSWRAQDCPVIAVLVCGHVYHSDCLETTTDVGWERDPACPSCILEKNQNFKFSANVPIVEKQSDSSLDSNSDVEAAICEMETCPSSSKQPVKGFFRRLGLSGRDPACCEGFCCKENGILSETPKN